MIIESQKKLFFVELIELFSIQDNDESKFKFFILYFLVPLKLVTP